ncbi:LysR family transcriptional regulator [Ferrimonas lipolytica]|uniref:LysR family transcriptional regulator n=1 Tax=Ferrimonas lipolytica TaxID=2724191 RepID=A0A6H1UIK8_9GAMM|nr:LysR family transcriptional regulator [Ferrimonas lipolytica]QIZ78153.1 LysR family transcriptional regulator [Ferrimonas lipolytica]
MNLEAVTVFQSVANLLSISRAAEVLDIPTSSISRKIRALEQELGAELFHRGGKRITLTHQGELLLQRAEVITAEIAQIKQEISCHDDSITGEIRIATPPSLASILTTSFFIPFQQRYPQIQLSIQSTQGRQLDELLDCDFAISPNQPRDQSLIASPICKVKRYFCASKRFIATFGEPTSPEQLNLYPFLSLAHSNLAKGELHWNNGKGKSGQVPITSYASSDSPAVLAQMMLADKGIACLPEMVLAELPQDQFQLLFNGEILDINDLYIIYSSRRYQLPRVRLLIDELVENIRQWSSTPPAQ